MQPKVSIDYTSAHRACFKETLIKSPPPAVRGFWTPAFAGVTRPSPRGSGEGGQGEGALLVNHNIRDGMMLFCTQALIFPWF